MHCLKFRVYPSNPALHVLSYIFGPKGFTLLMEAQVRIGFTFFLVLFSVVLMCIRASLSGMALIFTVFCSLEIDFVPSLIQNHSFYVL